MEIAPGVSEELFGLQTLTLTVPLPGKTRTERPPVEPYPETPVGSEAHPNDASMLVVTPVAVNGEPVTVVQVLAAIAVVGRARPLFE
jgi:hypothetical protein